MAREPVNSQMGIGAFIVIAIFAMMILMSGQSSMGFIYIAAIAIIGLGCYFGVKNFRYLDERH